jgi:hypothetical protein
MREVLTKQMAYVGLDLQCQLRPIQHGTALDVPPPESGGRLYSLLAGESYPRHFQQNLVETLHEQRKSTPHKMRQHHPNRIEVISSLCKGDVQIMMHLSKTRRDEKSMPH